MIKKVFMFHMGFIILNAIGVITVLFLKVWDFADDKLCLRLFVSFILGILLGCILLIPMIGRYSDKGLLK